MMLLLTCLQPRLELLVARLVEHDLLVNVGQLLLARDQRARQLGVLLQDFSVWKKVGKSVFHIYKLAAWHCLPQENTGWP